MSVYVSNSGVEDMIREYKINQRNSTVCGYPGRTFDWSKFDWDGKTQHDFGKMRYYDGSEVQKELRGKLLGVQTAPIAWVDKSEFKKGHWDYLHVPYDWAAYGTIYRVRANDCMYPGERYRGHIVKELRAVKHDDGWYWQLEFEE